MAFFFVLYCYPAGGNGPRGGWFCVYLSAPNNGEAWARVKIWGNAPHHRQAGNDTRATQTTTQDIDARSARKNSGECRKGCFVRVKGAWLNPYENGEGAWLTGRPNAPALPTLLGVGGAGGAGGGWGPNSPADPRKETKFPRRSPYGRGEMAAPLHRAAPQILTHNTAGPTSARGRARMIPADNKKNASDRRRRFGRQFRPHTN